MINRDKFFPPVRQKMFAGVLRQHQVDGINTLLDEWEARYPAGDLRWLAYCLATTLWETAHTMQPIEEWGKGHGMEYGVPDPLTGKVYYGRGYVQLTWRANYRKMSGIVGVDLFWKPELALDPKIAAAILYEGMQDGDFTGVGLPRYFNATTENWNGARAIINGDADADHNGIPDSVDIGNLGRVFYAILQGAT